MATLKELEQQQADLAKRIAEMRAAARQEVLSQIKSLMAEHGLSTADLSASPSRKSGGPTVGSKVAPKYRDPQTGATWTGRGLKPKWLKQSLEQGKTLEEFAI